LLVGFDVFRGMGLVDSFLVGSLDIFVDGFLVRRAGFPVGFVEKRGTPPGGFVLFLGITCGLCRSSLMRSSLIVII